MEYLEIFALCGLFALLLVGCVGGQKTTAGSTAPSTVGSNPSSTGGSSVDSLNDGDLSVSNQNDSNLISSQDIVEPG